MRLLVLSPGFFDKSGIARYGRYQVRALRERLGEDRVTVLSLMGRLPGDLEEPFDVNWSGAMPMDRLSRSHFVLKAVERGVRWRPDVVLCAHVNHGPVAWFIARAVSARFVQNIYGREVWSGLGWLRCRALGTADAVISDCHNTADRACELNLVARRPAVVWDCIDTSRFHPSTPAWDGLASYGLCKTERFRILFLGRLNQATRYKGFVRLIELLAELPADDFEVAIAGKGNDVTHLEELARSLGVAQRVVLTGPVHEDDLADVYRCADAFYLVSEVGPGMGEGIPLTPMEAMACGAPLLVGDADGSRELLNGAGGWCGSHTDVDAQLEYLLALRRDRELHASERKAARVRAETAFAYPRFATETIEAIERAIAAP